MSRNKDIKKLHSVMGLEYSYLRKRLKANRWDYWTTFHEIQYDLAYRFDRVSLGITERLQIAFDELNSSIERATLSIEEFRKLMTEGESNNA